MDKTKDRSGWTVVGGTALAALTMAVALMLADCGSAGGDAGQLFCALQTAGGGTIVAGLVDAAASAEAPTLAPIAIVATNATQTFVNNACTQAAVNTGAVAAVPVSPPASPATAPTIAVVKSAVTTS